MKKALLFALLLSFSAIQAQDILITDSSGTIWNNDTIKMEKYMSTADANDSFFDLKFERAFIKNNSDSVLTIKVERAVFSYPTGINDQICWGGICEQTVDPFSSIRVSALYAEMGPDSIIAGGGSGFAGYYLPRGNYGTVYFKYTFFDQNSKVPSSSFVIAFKVKNPVGIEEEKGRSKFAMSPNPASEYFKLEGIKSHNSSGQVVEILNITGKIVSEKQIINSTDLERIDITNLRPGIYFVRVKTTNAVSETQKLVVR